MRQALDYIWGLPFFCLRRTKMKRTIASISVLGIVLIGGCSSSNDSTPIPLPSISVKPSETVSEGATATPTEPTSPPKTVDPTEGTDGDDNPDPKPQEPVPTTTEAVPPATQFAQRWGAKYRDVPEFAILKAANGTCRIIDSAGVDWNNDPEVVAGIKAAVTLAGLDSNDAVEFAQDANQNYCSSIG
jgi:hypothetical protein